MWKAEEQAMRLQCAFLHGQHVVRAASQHRLGEVPTVFGLTLSGCLLRNSWYKVFLFVLRMLGGGVHALELLPLHLAARNCENARVLDASTQKWICNLKQL
jgi:hypothetical protein